MDDGDVSCAFSEFKLTRLKSVSVSRQSLFSRLWHGGQWYYHLIGQDRNIPPLERDSPLGLIARYYPEGKKIGNLQNSFTFKVLFFKFDIKIWLRYIFQIDQSRRNWIKHWNQCKWISIELCNCITLRILSLSYLSDYLTRSDSTDCKRIPREENTYCNRLHYQKLLVHFFSLSRIPDHNSSMQTAIFFSLKLYPSRASSWCILFSYYCKGLINN